MIGDLGRRDAPAARALRFGAAAAGGLAVAALTVAAPLAVALLAVGAAALAGLSRGPLRPIVLLVVVVVLIAFTSAMPRGLVVPLLAPNEALLLLVLVVAVVEALLARRRNVIPSLVLVGIAAFALGTSFIPLGAYLLRGVSLETADFFSLLAPLHYLVLFWLFAHVPRGERERRAVVHVMVATGSIVALIGLLQAAGVGPVVALLERWYPHGHLDAAGTAGRVTSVLGAWNALGLYLLTNLLLIAAVAVDEKRPLGRLNLRVATALALLCLLATNLYSGLIGVVVGYALIKRLDPRGIGAVVPLVVIGAIGFVLLLPELTLRFGQQFGSGSWIPQTLGFRWYVWQEYFIPPIAASPIWGVHPTYGHLAFPYPESQYIHYLFRSGLVSLAGHLVWLGALTLSLVRMRRRLEERFARSLALVPLALMLVFSLIGLINPVFTYTASMASFWIVLGLVVNAHAERRSASAGPAR
jgi:hypothetical protein